MNVRVLAAVAGLALPACFANEGPRFYPEWHVKSDARATIAGCAELDGWVAKTGKQGLGLVLHLRGTSPTGCPVAITSVDLRIEGDTMHATRLPASPMLRLGQDVFAYVPIAFDGNAAWNDEQRRHALLTIGTSPAASAPIAWPIELELRERFACEDGPRMAPPPRPPPPPPPPPPLLPQPPVPVNGATP